MAVLDNSLEQSTQVGDNNWFIGHFVTHMEYNGLIILGQCLSCVRHKNRHTVQASENDNV